MKRISLKFVLICLTAILGCEDGDLLKEQDLYDEVVLSQATRIIPQGEYSENLISINESSMVFERGGSTLDEIQPGDFLVSSVGAGLLRKVISISASGETIVMQTIPAAITDVLERGSGTFTHPLTIEDTSLANIQTRGLSFERSVTDLAAFYVRLDNVVLYDGDEDTTTTDDQVKLNGAIAFGPEFTLTIVVENWAIQVMEFSTTQVEDLDLSVAATVANYSVERERTLASFSFQPILVFIGPLPVVISPELEIIAGYSGSTSVSVEMSISQDASFSSGVRFENGAWLPFNEESHSFESGIPALNAAASFEAYVGPQLEFLLYDVSGPTVDLTLYGEVQADPTASPWLSIFGGIKANVGVEVEIFDRLLTGYEAEVLDLRVVLYESSVLPSSIGVQSPVEDDLWQIGTSEEIVWTSQGISGNVSIQLYKGGSFYSSITSSTPNDGSYTWTIPLTNSPASDYQVRIASTSNSSVFDLSEFFTLVAPPAASITVTEPDPGESWQMGTSHSIVWTSQNVIGNISIQLHKAGSFLATISSSTPNDGIFTWTIPVTYTSASDYQIRIASTSNSAVFDLSGNFTLTAAPLAVITVTEPDPGESWEMGLTHSITWTSQGLSGNVLIQLYKGGSFLATIISSTSNDGIYSWLIPTTFDPASNYQVRIASTGNSSVFDLSGNFALTTQSGSGEFRFVLTWYATPDDLDAHLLKGGIHVYYANRGSPTSQPYAQLDVDDTDGYGPETITVFDIDDDLSQYYVHNYSNEVPLTSSGARLTVYSGSTLVRSFNVPTSGSGRYWYVCDLTSSGQIVTRNILQDDPPGGATREVLPAKTAAAEMR